MLGTFAGCVPFNPLPIARATIPVAAPRIKSRRVRGCFAAPGIGPALLKPFFDGAIQSSGSLNSAQYTPAGTLAEALVIQICFGTERVEAVDFGAPDTSVDASTNCGTLRRTLWGSLMGKLHSSPVVTAALDWLRRNALCRRAPTSLSPDGGRRNLMKR